jgi:hypothetical protein
MREFAKLHNSRGTLLGSEFLGQTLDELKVELAKLNMPSPVNPAMHIAAHHRAGGVEKVRKLELIIGFLEHNQLDVWTHAKADAA